MGFSRYCFLNFTECWIFGAFSDNHRINCSIKKIISLFQKRNIFAVF